MSAAPEAAAGEAATSRYTKWAIALFFVALFIPGSFYVGVRMTPFRLYLILMAAPMVLRYRADPTLRVTSVDALVFLAIAWRSLAILVNHQASEILNAGAFFIELFFGYMLGRVFVRSAADYRFFFKCFLVTLLAFLPFALLEFATRQRVLRNVFGFLVQPPLEVSSPQIRYGFMRVQASFNHAIHFGVFCALGFSSLFYLYHDRVPRNLLYAGFSAFMALLAISSSSVLMLAVQGALIAYDIVLRFLRAHWILLAVGAVALWYLFRLAMGMSIVDYVVTELVFNQVGAEGRVDQIVYGLQEIARNPVFGIGLAEPTRPFWRGGAIDNFWLATGLRYGIAAFTFISLAFLIHFVKISRARAPNIDVRKMRTGYMISYFTFVLFLGSLNIYGIMLVFGMVFFGCGAWFYDTPASRAPEPPPRRRAPARRPPPAAPARGGYSAGAGRSTTAKPPSGAGSRA